VFALGCEVAGRLKRNGVLRSDNWFRGLASGGSPAAALPVLSEMRTDIQYDHKIVAVAVVSTPFPIPLGIRFQKDGEGEVSCALALLKDLVGQLGRCFLDVLVGDALYLQSSFVQEVEGLGPDWAFTLKENQPELLREAERFTQGPPAGVSSEAGRELR